MIFGGDSFCILNQFCVLSKIVRIGNAVLSESTCNFEINRIIERDGETDIQIDREIQRQRDKR